MKVSDHLEVLVPKSFVGTELGNEKGTRCGTVWNFLQNGSVGSFVTPARKGNVDDVRNPSTSTNDIICFVVVRVGCDLRLEATEIFSSEKQR